MSSSYKNIKRRLNQKRLLQEDKDECLGDLENLNKRYQKIIMGYIDKKNDLTDKKLD
jgi:hypothetical protein